jgi:hypothetical protein
MRFQRGQSGNPGGRPRMPEKLRLALEALSEKAVERLGALLDHHSGAIRLRAAERILDRAWGRPAIAVDIGELPETSVSRMSTAALERLVAEIEKVATKQVPGES